VYALRLIAKTDSQSNQLYYLANGLNSTSSLTDGQTSSSCHIAMPQRVDKLWKRCEELLTSGEGVLLEAEATCKLGLLSQFGAGRAYLTDRRILWIRRSTPLLRPLLFWIPDVVSIELPSIDRLHIMRELAWAWLWIHAAGKIYSIRPGKGPYPMLRDNRKTTEEWFHAIEGARTRLHRDSEDA
jgi:hypothetical protein